MSICRLFRFHADIKTDSTQCILPLQCVLLAKMEESNSNWFVSLTKVTLVSIFLIVVAGGVVRMTGSGMGCPDWPKCFEQYIPPTDVSQLPENYKDIYAAKREKQIHRFTDMLEKMGMEEKAIQLRNDRSLLEEQDFNAFNTWTEYVNRLIGAISGIFVFAVFLLSFRRFKKAKWLVVLSGFQVVLMGFQAWMGAMTVATNLTPWVLTTHMLLAILIIGVQLKIIRLAQGKAARTIQMPDIQFKILLWVAIAISGVQILAGTGVRQLVDGLEGKFERANWIEQLGSDVYFHRSFAIAVLVVNGFLFFLNYKKNIRLKETNWLLVIIW